jgi:hypothetical protein
VPQSSGPSMQGRARTLLAKAKCTCVPLSNDTAAVISTRSREYYDDEFDGAFKSEPHLSSPRCGRR